MEQNNNNISLIEDTVEESKYQLYINDTHITRYDNIIIEGITYQITNDGAQSESREPVTHPATNTLIKNPKLSFLYSWITSKENRDLIITRAKEITITEKEGFVLADGDDLYTSDFELFVPLIEDENSSVLPNGGILYTTQDEELTSTDNNADE